MLLILINFSPPETLNYMLRDLDDEIKTSHPKIKEKFLFNSHL